MTITPEEVAKLAAAATPAPWEVADNGEDVWSGDDVVCEWAGIDAPFIAAAHDMAALIAEQEAKLAKAVDALRGWIEFANEEGMPVLLSDLEAAELTGENT